LIFGIEMAEKITVLFTPRKITILYTMYPFWISAYRKNFQFTTNLKWVLKQDKNQKILLVGWFQKQDRDGKHKKLLLDLRKKYNRIFFFDDNDGSESHFLDLLPYVDLYYKKQVFKDRGLYGQGFYGKRIFTDYYHREFGVDESPMPESLPALGSEEDLGKMKVLWNLAFGQYPVSKHRHKIAKVFFMIFGDGVMQWLLKKMRFDFLPKPLIQKCQARFGYKEYRPLVGYQRKRFLELVDNSEYFLKGKIPLSDYNREVTQVMAVLSPYGWGEVCFRDLEAILNGCVLVKPDMSHIETWPDIFIPGKTYIPVKWDGSDILQSVGSLLSDQEKIDEVRSSAWEVLKSSHAELDEKVRMIIEDFRI
jgi:hypothetical protein